MIGWLYITRSTRTCFFIACVFLYRVDERFGLRVMWCFSADMSGMGVSTVSAARILRGQMEGQSGEETVLAMDTFPYVALSKVWRFSLITHRSFIAILVCSYIKAGLGCQTNANGMRICVAWKNCCLSSDYIFNFPYRDSCWTGCGSLKSRVKKSTFNIYLLSYYTSVSV